MRPQEQMAAGVAYGIGCIGGSLMLGVWKKSDIRLIANLAGRVPQLHPLLNWAEQAAREG